MYRRDSGIFRVEYHRFGDTMVCCITMTSGAGVVGYWNMPTDVMEWNEEEAEAMAYGDAVYNLDHAECFLSRERRYIHRSE